MPRSMRALRAGRIAITVAFAIVVAACGLDIATPAPRTPAPRPSPTPGPPTIRASTISYQLNGGRFTLQVVVDPNDSPTDVAFEYGSGSTFDQTLVMAEEMVDLGWAVATIDAVPADWWPCGRVTATNALGSVSLDVGCLPRPTLPTAPPNPSASPSG